MLYAGGAQALLKAPAVLLIDDAFAAFDPESKAKVWQSIVDTMKGQTVILAVSDPSGFEGADRIVRLESGQATELAVHRAADAA